MNRPDPFERLRELPLPALDPELTARVRRRAHALLAAPARGRTPLLMRFVAAAAVVLLCVLHAGWTIGFIERLRQ